MFSENCLLEQRGQKMIKMAKSVDRVELDADMLAYLIKRLYTERRRVREY